MVNYVELSLKDVKSKAKELYKMIKKSYDYDLVIFIASGSYLIGSEIAMLNNVPLLEIKATRKGGKLKKLIKPILVLLPKKLLINLRTKEIKSNFHEKNNDRKVSFNEKAYKKYNNKSKILLVDDSIDSGYSVKYAKQVLEKYFKNSEIRIAVFNCMKNSKVKANYYLYENTMLCGPWSNDSKENKKHKKLYSDWKKEYING